MGKHFTTKKLAICRLVGQQSVDVLFLQETMGDGVSFASSLEFLLPGWTFCSVDAKGKSGVCWWDGEIEYFIS